MRLKTSWWWLVSDSWLIDDLVDMQIANGCPPQVSCEKFTGAGRADLHQKSLVIF